MSRLFICLILLAAIQPVRAQNSYPATGDALINGLTIGQGSGSASNQNVALGYRALYSNSGGWANVAVGFNSLYSTTGVSSTGYENTAVGNYSGYSNTTGWANTTVGSFSMNSNTTGFMNTACGSSALSGNSTGSSNVAVGNSALIANSTGNTNTGLGFAALNGCTSGNSNVAVGVYALGQSSSTSNLVAVGDSALWQDQTAGYNTAIGSKTLFSTTTGMSNTALGYQGLYSNSSGYSNTATGTLSLYSNSNGAYNTATGGYSLYANNSGNDNTSNGALSMFYTTSGSANSGFGVEALINNTTGSNNTGIGAFAGPASANLSNSTAIGYRASTTASNSVVIGNSSVTSIGGYAGWTNFSDGRFKKNINHNVPGLAFINKLAPITYTLDIDGIEAMRAKANPTTRRPNEIASTHPSDDPAMKQAIKEKAAVVYTGFVAQDVEQAARSIGYDFSGVDKPKDAGQSFYGLRYSDFVVPLVKAVQELSARNDSLERRLDQIEQLLGINSADQHSSTLNLSSAHLAQNIPNPFTQTTLINYFLPQSTGSAVLQITAIHGEVIKSFALNGTGAGQLTLQTAQLAAGTYTYSLIVDGNLIDTKKMVVVK